MEWRPQLYVGLLLFPCLFGGAEVFAQSAQSDFGRGNSVVVPPSLADQLRPDSLESQTHAKAVSGDVSAQYQWGLFLEQAVTGKPELEEAAKQFRWAAEKGYAPAMTALGSALYYGRGVAQNLPEAVQWYREAAEAQDAIAMHNLGVIYERGIVVEKNLDTALDWYERADAAKFFILFQNSERLAKSRAEAQKAAASLTNVPLNEVTRRANSGDAAAMFELSVRYDTGRSVAQNEAKALEWLQKAADKKHAEALLNLGGRHRNGRGVPKNDVRAVSYWKQAADLKDPDAMSNVAYAFREGIGGVPKEMQRALDLYVEASELGSPVAMNNIAMLYRTGKIVPPEPGSPVNAAFFDLSKPLPKAALKYRPNGQPDYAQALDWFRRAAELSEQDSMNAMGFAYLKGEGVAEDVEVASDWFRSCESTQDRSRKNLRAIALTDGYSAFTTLLAAMTASEDDPDKSKLYAIAAGNSFYGQGGAKKNLIDAYANLTMAARFGKSMDLALIAMEMGEAHYGDHGFESAQECYQIALDCGDPRAAMNLGLLAQAKDPAAAEQFYKQGEELAAKKGESVQRGTLHLRYTARIGPYVRPRKPLIPLPEVKLPKSLEEMTRLADGGDAEANFLVGSYLYSKFDEEGACLPRFQAAANKNHAKAMLKLAQMYKVGDEVAINLEQALEWYRKAVEAGEPDGYAGMGEVYALYTNDHDRIVNRKPDEESDYQRQEEALRKGAELGSVKAMRLLGNFLQEMGASYYRPSDPPRTDTQKEYDLDRLKEAVKWYRQAADKGDAVAMRLLAWLTANGYGADASLDEAIKLSQQALDAGAEESRLELARYLLQANTPESDTRCIELMTKAVESDPDNDEAAYLVAFGQANGRGIAQNLPAAAASFKRLAWRGMAEAWDAWAAADPQGAHVHELRQAAMRNHDSAIELAKAYGQGNGVPREPALAAHWVEQATYGDNVSLDHVALHVEMLASGTGCYPLPELAIQKLQPGIEQNHPGSLRTMGQLLLTAAGMPADDERALSLLTQAAEHGDIQAMFLLGQCHRGGLATPTCAGLAADGWRKAAEQGHTPSMLALGGLFVEGNGAPLDDHAASRWYLQAWIKGDGQGYEKFEHVAAKIFEMPDDPGFGPQGVPKKARLDYNDMYTLAEKESPNPMYMLGRMYLEGIGHPRDVVKGKVLIEKSATAGHSRACKYFAQMYRTGIGVPKDDNFASYWDTKAQLAEQRERTEQRQTP